MKRISLSVLILLGVLAVGAGAGATSLRQTDATATAEYKQAKTQAVRAIDTYKSARADYLSAKTKYEKSKSKEDLQTTLTEAKDYVLRADEAMISYLELLKVKVEKTEGMSAEDKAKSLSEITADITWLKSQQATIQAADSRDALTAAALPVKNRWETIKATAKRISGRVLAAHVNYALGKMTGLEPEIQERIDAAKSSGKDTTEVTTLFDSYKASLDAAENSYKAAVLKFNAITNIKGGDDLLRDGRNSLQEANTSIRTAHATLKQIVAALKNIQSKDVEGTGRLYVQGDGTAVFTGNGSVDGTTGVGTDASKASLRVVDNAGDAVVTTDGKGTKQQVDAKTTLYTGVGQVKVTGTNVVATVTGPNLDIIAEGTGKVTMTGKGTYKTSKTGASTAFDAKGVTVTITGPKVGL